MEKKICPICGNEISPLKRSQFCSKKCQQRDSYLKNKDKRAEYKKQDYQDNKERCKQLTKEWVALNREKWNEYVCEYKKKTRQKEDNE